MPKQDKFCISGYQVSPRKYCIYVRHYKAIYISFKRYSKLFDLFYQSQSISVGIIIIISNR